MTILAYQLPVVAGEQLTPGRVKGSMIRAHLDWVRDHAAREETIELFEALPGDVRQRVSTVLPSSWYDFATLIAVDRTIAARFGSGPDDLAFLEELGAYSARTNLAGVCRFFRRDGVHDFFRSSAVLHRTFQDFGTAEYVELAPNAGVMHHREYTAWSPLYCASAAGFYRQCVTLHGGKDVEVAETECQCAGAASCTFVIGWR